MNSEILHGVWDDKEERIIKTGKPTEINMFSDALKIMDRDTTKPVDH